MRPNFALLYTIHRSLSKLLVDALTNLARSTRFAQSAGLTSAGSPSSVWAKPPRPGVCPSRAPRFGIFLLLYFCIAAHALAQENLPPSFETEIAAGVQALKSGDLNSAEQVFTDALRQGIKHPLLYHNLGVIAQLRTAWAKLSGWSYGQLTGINPDSARVHQALGQEYVIQEKYDLAIAAYRQAARSDPTLPEIHLAMALIWLELKKFDDALGEVQLEPKLVPESKAALDARARIEAAIAASTP